MNICCEYNNLLYFPDKDGTVSNGYWLASPSAYEYSYIMCVYSDGGIDWDNYHGCAYMATRPIVSLPTIIVNQ